MRKKLVLSFSRAGLKLMFGLLALCGCPVAWAQSLPIDAKASDETKNLNINLQKLSQKGTLFGHHDDLAYGIGWQYEPGRSDVKEMVGEYPVLAGWNLCHLELGRAVNLDSVPFLKMRGYRQQVYRQGGVNTVSWHLNHPLDPGKTSWDKINSTISRLFTDRQALARPADCSAPA